MRDPARILVVDDVPDNVEILRMRPEARATAEAEAIDHLPDSDVKEALQSIPEDPECLLRR